MTRLLYISVCLRTRQDTISYSSDIYSSETGTSIDGYGEKTKDEYDKDEYDEKTSMAKDEYALVREHLGVVAQRMKRRYDIRVRPQKFRKGQWVLYYNPRRFQGKQQKWERKYSPHLVIKELPPVNYLIQKSKHSRPIISHIDKLKTWETDNPPKSWVTDDFDRRTDDAGVAGDRDPDNGDVGINGPGGDDEV